MKDFNSSKIYSQDGQDAFVIEYFENKKNGIFVDIGAYNGINLSNTYYLEKELEWAGICFEPNPSMFDILNINRNCIKIMAGVAEKKSTQKFTCAGTLSGISDKYDKRHVERIKREFSEIVEVEINCIVLNDILEEYNIFNIDYLSIDTEGNELEIISSIDFNKFNIELMTIENNYNDKKQTDFIISKGYNLIGKLGGDEIFTKIK